MTFQDETRLWTELRHALWHWLCRCAPLAVTLLLLLLSHAPGAYVALAPVMPPLALMAVFYWSVHRPDWFGVVSAFVVGLLVDVLLGAPLGISAGLYAVSHILLTRQQRFFKGTTFPLVWGGYAVTQLAVTVGQALLWWLLLARAPHLGDVLTLNILGALLFPPVCWILSRLQKLLGDTGQ